MRYLITVVIAALSLNAFGQGIPQLPYNPDENGDGLIGVPDLQALLAQYGLEFNSAVLSEDAQSAIVYMGQMAHPVCSQACDNLPGFWHMSTMADLGLVWDEINSFSDNATWINYPKEGANYSNNDVRAYHYLEGQDHSVIQDPFYLFKCYCAAHEMPKVEYKVLSITNSSTLESSYNEAADEGWRLLPAAEGNSQRTTMWRWAE